MKVLEGWARHDMVNLLSNSVMDCVGVELGVAGGGFSKRMVMSGRFAHFFGVDLYGDHHNTDEYKFALLHVGLFANYKILRMTFDDALSLFEDCSIDFVYVDGYAHSGEEGGDTIYKWFRKVRVGGVIAGDDYHPNWPLVVRAVDKFASDVGAEVYITEIREQTSYDQFPSWGLVKQAHVTLEAPPEMVGAGKAAGRATARRRAIRAAAETFLPSGAFRVLRIVSDRLTQSRRR